MRNSTLWSTFGQIAIIAVVFAIVTFGGTAMAQECGSNHAGATAGANAAIETGAIQFPEQKDLTTSNSNGKGYRPFPESGQVPMAPLPGYFGDATKGCQYQDVPTLTKYKDTFTLDEMKKMAKGPWGSKPIVTPLVAKVADEDMANEIKVTIDK
jgi:hypothetical protein